MFNYNLKIQYDNLLGSGIESGDSRCYLKTPKCSSDHENPIDSTVKQ